MSACNKCGEPIVWRQSAKGRKYPVNGVGGSGPLGQFHSTSCPARKAKAAGHAEFIPQDPETSKAAQGLGSWHKPEGEDFDTFETESETKIAANNGTQQDGTDLASVIARHVAGLMPKQEATIDADAVRKIVRDEVTSSGARNVVVTVKDSSKPAIDVGRQHDTFATLLAIVARRRNVWLAGPAGSGKTSGAHAVATALDLAFGSVSVGPQTTQSAIFGYMDAHGNYVATEFRRRYELGGVFLFDEIDRGNPGVLTALNQAIENGACAFPDGMIPRHPDFVAIAAANTFGNGASREYVGAMQLDAATLDRFVMLAWNYDETLELDIARATFEAAGGTDDKVLANWIAKVRFAREKAQALKIRHVVSPRASIIGAELLAAGMNLETVSACVLWKGLDADSVERMTK